MAITVHDNPTTQASHPPGVACFGRFRLVIHERRLERDGTAIPIGGRALDLLIRLARAAGEVVSKGSLAQAAWPGLTVEEGNLRFHIASLRKILDVDAPSQSLLQTIAGRGYSLTANVRWSSGHGLAAAPILPLPPLPALARRMIAAAGSARQAMAQLATRRLLTLVGPAGIGKTTLALCLSHEWVVHFGQQAVFVDLSAIADPAMVAQAIAVATATTPPGTTGDIVFEAAPTRGMLLVLDGCEHVIDTVAALVEGLLRDCPDLTILATSRESLRIESEAVHRLFPLACPPHTTGLTCRDLLQYPAALLLIERLQAFSVDFQITDEDVPAIVEICHRLDGIPLALELAAGCVPSHGLRHTTHLLTGHFRLLWKGRRTAPPRHQTLRAALDWSYDLLSDTEQKVLRRIAVFVGCFSLDAAVHVAGGDDTDADDTINALSSLIEKSMLHIDEPAIGQFHYRLLDTTRVYALDKLGECAEAQRIMRRHAELRDGGCPQSPWRPGDRGIVSVDATVDTPVDIGAGTAIPLPMVFDTGCGPACA